MTEAERLVHELALAALSLEDIARELDGRAELVINLDGAPEPVESCYEGGGRNG
jgi:hypothetical protein